MTRRLHAPGAYTSSQETQRGRQIQPLVVTATCRVLTTVLKGVVPQVAISSSNGKDGPAESSFCLLPGGPAGPFHRGFPKGEEEEGQDGGWCLGNCHEAGGTGKSYTNTNSVKGEACGFFTWKKQEIFFSDHDFFHHKFPRVHAAAPSHSSHHQLPFCES